MIPDRDKLTPADVIAYAVIIACVVFLLSPFHIGFIDGNSMAPTLGDGGVVVYSSTTYCIRRGDIVVFRLDCGALVKRVIAVPGDTISIKGGVVTLNGVEMSESYTAPGLYSSGDTDYPCRIPSGCYFVLGDNRAESRDSRMRCIGLIPEENIVGRVFHVV